MLWPTEINPPAPDTSSIIEKIKILSEKIRLGQNKINFHEALKISEGVLNQYKIDHPKWWRRMDGTPILNDLAVRMAEAFSNKE